MSMAREFSEIWSTGDPSPADKILAEDVKSSDVIFASSGTQGREAWKQMINGVFKVRQTFSQCSHWYSKTPTMHTCQEALDPD